MSSRLMLLPYKSLQAITLEYREGKKMVKNRKYSKRYKHLKNQ